MITKKSSLRATAIPSSGPRRRDGDGNVVKNEILLRLPRPELDRVMAKAEFVQLKLHQVLYEAGQTIKSAYFVNEGLISILSVQPDGRSVEVGLIGNEGFTGLPLLVGFRSSPTRAMTQGDGAAYRCDAASLTHLRQQCPALEIQLHRFGQRLAMQTTQIAACNRLHDVVERLARWILMSRDRIAADTLPLTQEFLAQMLGTRRSSVTVAAGILQKAGLISYTRGTVRVVNRSELEDAACDCYRVIQQQLGEWDKETA